MNELPAASDIVNAVEVAFAHLEFPVEDKLTLSYPDDETRALCRDFKDQTDWSVLDAPFLDQAPEGWSSALNFFSPEAFRFYLPAYLIADLKGGLQSVDPAGRLCMGLIGDGEKSLPRGGEAVPSERRVDAATPF